MITIHVRNVNEALPTGLALLREVGYERASRNGPVTLFPCPVTTTYENPTERVIFWAERDAHPFFHFFESLWMLEGRNDTRFVTDFVKRMGTFSDDGRTLHGAYGHRWRKHFGRDQLAEVILALNTNPDDRRCVVQMWDAHADLARAGKDVPCNTQALFSVNHQGAVDMTVFNRSNDMVWGAYGANAVHFSMLQEYVAGSMGREVGMYYQVSNNLHAYHDTLDKVISLADTAAGYEALAEEDLRCPYRTGSVGPFPLFSGRPSRTEWDQDLMIFMVDGPIVGFRTSFFRRVVTPLWMAWRAYKDNPDSEVRFDVAQEILQQCKATDWRLACAEWLTRRQKSAEAKRFAA